MSVDSRIADIINDERFMKVFKERLYEIRDPEKQFKAMETLLGYQTSKLKSQDVEKEDKYRPIQILYSRVGEEPLQIDNGEPVVEQEREPITSTENDSLTE